jgi:hypothetical protein
MATVRERLEYRKMVFPGQPMTDEELDRHIKREQTTKLVFVIAIAVLLALALYLFLR